MERRVILDFIVQNYEQLKKIDFTKIFIYLFGKKYQRETPILNGEVLFAYEVNLPRINFKTLSLDKMYEGILEFADTLEHLMIFSHNDITFDINEVYNEKNLKNIDFKFLYLQPIFIDKQLVGVISMYANNYDENFCFNKASLTVMVNQLEEADYKKIKQEIINGLFDANDYYYLLKNDENKVFLSTNLQEKFNINKSFVFFEDDIVKHFLAHYMVKEKRLSFPYENYKLFYCLKNMYDECNTHLLHIDAINKLNLPTEFTAVVVLWNDNRPFTDVTYGVSFGAEYYLCAYHQDCYLLIISRKYATNLINKLFKNYECNYFVLHAPSDINNQMNFKKIINYIENTRCEQFIYADYVSYLNKLNQEKMQFKIKKHLRIIINSKNDNQKLILLNDLPMAIMSDVNKNELEQLTFKQMNQFIKNNYQDFAVFLDSSSLTKRKNIEFLKKCQSKKLQVSFITYYNNLSNKEQFIEAISLLKEFNAKIYVTSSIFLNLELIDLMKFFDGCYVVKEEFNNIQLMPNNFMNMFISYFFNDNKIIIFEETTNPLINKRYEDELIFFVKESENNDNEWIK